MQIIADRRALHRIPEPELCLPKTMAYLAEALRAMPRWHWPFRSSVPTKPF